MTTRATLAAVTGRRASWLGIATALFLMVGLAPRLVQAAPLDGTVTNALTGAGVGGVTVTLEPMVPGGDTVTAPDGTYSVNVPGGDYTVNFTDDRFEPQSLPATVPGTLDAALDPVAPVIVSATLDGDAEPDAVLMATADIEILDGSTLLSVAWTQTGVVPVQIVGEDTETPTVTFPDTSTYKEGLVHVLMEPPIAEEDLPPNVELPPEGFVSGLQDRFQVVGINPFALEETALLVLHVEVTTDSGVYSDEVEADVHLPWKVAKGTPNVPLGIAVLLHGKDQADYDWALDLMGAPGSSAALVDATSQSPWFVPDVEGIYELTVTDAVTTEPVTIEVAASEWIGAITGQDMDGFPVAGECTICHNDDGPIAPDKVTPWSMTGHAEIFRVSLATNDHYSPNCFPCHTVGYDPEVDNSGFDDADDYGDFLASGLIESTNGDEWTIMLSDYPKAARLANVQCENCHGPLEASHANPSLLISSDVCATCHGEPLRHARFQQWQLSRHANYALAVDEGDSGNCSRCHTGNGFLAWVPVLLGEQPGDPLDDVQVTWTEDEVHPQTCATCHDPHAIGTTTGVGTNATVRVSGDTPPLIAGFTATDVGRGAICMTCHNTRRGLKNDDNFAEFYGTSEAARAPHPGAQADMLMGQNAFLVEVGIRGNHSKTENVADTCVTCHMEATPPPDLLSYNQGGSNHTFFASPEICAECHFGLDAGRLVQNEAEAKLDELQDAMEDAILELITAQTDRGRIVDLDEEAQITDPGIIEEIVFGEARGRQSIAVTIGGVEMGPYRMTDVVVFASDGTTELGQLYDFADPRVIKSGWNWNLVHNDGTRGAHNPTFTLDVLDASLDALQMVPEPGGLASVLAAGAAVAWLAHRSRRRSRGRSTGA